MPGRVAEVADRAMCGHFLAGSACGGLGRCRDGPGRRGSGRPAVACCSARSARHCCTTRTARSPSYEQGSGHDRRAVRDGFRLLLCAAALRPRLRTVTWSWLPPPRVPSASPRSARRRPVSWGLKCRRGYVEPHRAAAQGTRNRWSPVGHVSPRCAAAATSPPAPSRAT